MKSDSRRGRILEDLTYVMGIVAKTDNVQEDMREPIIWNLVSALEHWLNKEIEPCRAFVLEAKSKLGQHNITETLNTIIRNLEVYRTKTTTLPLS